MRDWVQAVMHSFARVNSLSNQRIISEICIRIQNELLENKGHGRAAPLINFRVSELDIDYWSFIFHVNWQEGDQERGIFVKIPRFNWHDDSIINAIRDPVAQNMGRTGFQSLTMLFNLSQVLGEGVKPVRPIAYWKDYNAILTEKVPAGELYTVIRAVYSPHIVQIRRPVLILENLLQRLGAWIARFHAHGEKAQQTLLDTREYAPEIESFWSGVIESCSEPKRAEMLANRLSQIILRSAEQIVPTVEGFEVRNILWDTSANQLYLVDPGVIKDRPRLEDLARFMVSLDVLYWGSMWFLFEYKASAALEHAFLQGYFRQGVAPGAWLRFFKTRELLKQWSAAYEVLRAKKLPKGLSGLIRKLYIDRFYFREIEKNIHILEKAQNGDYET